MFNFWWSAGLVNGLKPHLPPLSSQKNKMLIFGLCSTSDDRLGWSMDSNPICHTSPAKKIKCSFLDYVQLLMIGQVIQVMNGDWNAKKGLLIHQKMNCSFSDGLLEDCQKTTRRLSEDYQKTSRRPAKDHQKTARRPVEGCQKTTRRPPENHQKASGSLLTLWYKEISIKDYTSTWTAVP